jgi:amino acid transporter
MPRHRGGNDFLEDVGIFGLGAAVAAPQSPIGSFFLSAFKMLGYIFLGIIVLIIVVVLVSFINGAMNPVKQKFTLQGEFWDVPGGTPHVREEVWEDTGAGNKVAVYHDIPKA